MMIKLCIFHFHQMSRFTTLDSLKSGDEKDKKDKSSNEYYVGGASRDGGSGLSVEAPPDKNNLTGVEKLMEKAKATSMEGPPPSDSDAIIVTFWKNGFTVNDGPLRNGKSPEDQSFMKDIENGLCPKELQILANSNPSRDKSVPVNIQIADKRAEDYEEPPKPQYVAFSGDGHSLRSEIDTSSSGVYSSIGAPGPSVVDESLPTTVVQIRLSDGKRVKATLNTTHTVEDLRNYISHVSPADAFMMLSGFPPKPIQSLESTLEESGLLRGSVTQKLA